MENTLHIAELISRKIKGEIAPNEQLELDSWINKKPENKAVYERAINTRNQLDKLEIYQLFNKEKVRSKLEDELFPTKKIDFSYKRIMRFAAAILLPVILIGGAYLLLREPVVQNFAALDQIIEPGMQKAVLKLSNGEEVVLDENEFIKIIADGSKNIKNENQLIDYFNSESNMTVEELRYNELKTPNGGQYRLQLADGTKVWLNAGSSLRFPVSFSNKSRDVYLEGEAYFEVTKNSTPFNVYAGEMNVSVLGTMFNVSAYANDQNNKTTLAEGKVKVWTKQAESGGKILSPNQQATLDISSSEMEVSQVNASYYTSWVNGKIEFNNEDLEEVMKRLSRWYNFEYEFKNEAAKQYHFTARLSNDEKISSIIEMLELSADVKFEYKNETVIIR